MRLGTVVALVLCGAPVGLFSQTQSGWQNLPPGFVDGSKNPSLIPNTAAYRLVFLSLTAPPAGDTKALAKQTALIARIGLSGAAEFANDYSLWQANARATGSSANTAQLSSQITALVQQYRNLLVTRLSGDGAAKFGQFVESAKSRMVVRP